MAYAAERYVRVIPEIDVPGHEPGSTRRYPDLACMKAPSLSGRQQVYGEDENTLCVGKDATFEFMDKVLTEVARLRFRMNTSISEETNVSKVFGTNVRVAKLA